MQLAPGSPSLRRPFSVSLAEWAEMVISYSDNHLKILSLWTGSAWKTVWKELLLWLTFYYAVKLLLETILPPAIRQEAKKLVALFALWTDKVPLEFLLGFFVSQVGMRWWAQTQHIPWPDDIMAWVCALIPENDPEAQLKRHTVARYLLLSETLVLRTVSTRIRKRFPTLQSLVGCELMMQEELEFYNNCPCPYTSWQLPLQWALNGILIPLNTRPQNPVTMCDMGRTIQYFNVYRADLRQLFLYDWICIPLVYSQTVSVVVYGYFAMCLLGHQALGTDKDIFVPVLTIMQFFFYVGWFKVARDLMRPFGEDDEDSELNVLLDRHAAVAINMANYVIPNSPSLSEDSCFKNMQNADGLEPQFTLAYPKIYLTENQDRAPKLYASVDIKDPAVQLEMAFKTHPGSAESVSKSCHSSTNATGGAPDTKTWRGRIRCISTLISEERGLTKTNREHIHF